MSSSDLAYTAGFVDGEGCIHYRLDSNCGAMHRLEVSQKDRPVLDWLRSAVGAGRVSEHPNGKNTIHRWTCNRRKDVAALLTALLPFLKVKARQAKLMLFACKLSLSRPPGKKSKLLRRALRLLEAEIKSEKH